MSSTWRQPEPGRAVRGRFRNLPTPVAVSRFAGALLGRHRLSVLRALVDGIHVSWVLKRRGVRTLLADDVPMALVSDPRRATEVAEHVDVALAVLPLASTCLRRSLVLLRELRRQGLRGALHVGVRNLGVRPEAHAWIEVDEVVVNDDPALIATYTQLAAGELEQLIPMLK